MTLKLAVHSACSGPEGDPMSCQNFAFLLQNFKLAKSPDTEIYWQTPRGGLPLGTPWDFTNYPYLVTLNNRQIVEGIIQAEQDGFDAAIIYCGHDPGPWEAKQAVDIPVVGLIESASLVAATMGGKFGMW